MRATQFIIATLREAPADAVAVSHNLMLRAGLIRKLGAGLYHLLPAGLRSFRKVEQVIREEMNAAGALEMQLPILTPAELWERSQRWESMGRAMFRVQDRHDVWNVLGPTHEESFSELVAGLIHSYRDLPLNVYQIHTKFRDEIRPRYGVIRSREFCMKDAYSFHTDDASLEDTYQKMRVAYRRIFARLGLETVPVEADSGPMGGSGSEEFMVASEIGEDTLLLSEGGLYRSNQEKTPVLYAELDEAAASGTQPITDQKAKTKSKNKSKTIAESKSKSDLKLQSKAGADATQKTGPALAATTDIKKLEAVHTPGCRTIEDVAKFLKVDVRGILKTVVYMADGKPIGICLRGDRQLNEVKLKNHLGANELLPAEAEDIKAMGSVAGFVAPLHLKNTTILWDRSVLTGEKWITGSNRTDYHCLEFVPEPERESFDFALAVAGDPSPAGDGLLKEMKGIEVGHIFKLGRKYTDAFQISVLDENGKAIIPTMGCYGVGVNRTLATVIEQWHDDAGIKWPISAAPFEVCLIDIARQPEEKAQAEALYTALCTAGVDVFWDDRDARPGIKFNDADLIGYPIRITMGKSYFQNGELEVNDRSRDESHKWTGNTEELLEKILKLRTELYTLLEQRVQQSLMD